MSGPGYPFPEYKIEKVQKHICPLPSEAYKINDYHTCTTLMNECQKNSATNDHYRNQFHNFATRDAYVSIPGDPGRMQYEGGCKILLAQNCEVRNALWQNAQTNLYGLLKNYHENVGQREKEQSHHPKYEV